MQLNYFFIDICKPFLGENYNNLPSPVGLVSDKSDNPDYVSRLEYERLWSALQKSINQIDRLRTDYEKLSKFRSSLPAPSTGFVKAGVLKSVTGFGAEFLIDKGSEQGIRNGQAVLYYDAFIGTVIETSTHTSRVRLVSDSQQKLRVRIVSGDSEEILKAWMVGDGKGMANVLNIETRYKIKRGYSVHVDSEPGFLEMPVYCGNVDVVQVDEDTPLIYEIKVKPAFGGANIDSVVVAVMVPVDKEGGQ